MKIRLLGQSVRLRLGKSEVATLAAGEPLEAITSFGPAGKFGCVVRRDPKAPAAGAVFAEGRLILRIPDYRIDDWAGSDDVGIDFVQHLSGGQTLRVLIEKDFACTDGASDESQDDAFPNPSAKC